MLELYSHPQSPCAQKVRIVLAEKDISYTKIHVDLPSKENLTPQYLKLNPLGVVPTLVSQGKPVIESSIICEYLDDIHPNPRLSPGDKYQRSKMRYWMKQIDTKLHPSCGALQWPLLMRPKLMEMTEQQRDKLLNQVVEKPRRERQKRLVKFGLDAPDIVDAIGVYQKIINDMELALADSNWIVSDRFSLADACLIPYFQTLIQFGWTELFTQDKPLVRDWIKRCTSRHSFKVAVSNDFSNAELEDMLAKGRTALSKIETHLELTI